jgi:hypothetical protein
MKQITNTGKEKNNNLPVKLKGTERKNKPSQNFNKQKH